jgi:hypothetical protein
MIAALGVDEESMVLIDEDVRKEIPLECRICNITRKAEQCVPLE